MTPAQRNLLVALVVCLILAAVGWAVWPGDPPPSPAEQHAQHLQLEYGDAVAHQVVYAGPERLCASCIRGRRCEHEFRSRCAAFTSAAALEEHLAERGFELEGLDPKALELGAGQALVFVDHCGPGPGDEARVDWVRFRADGRLTVHIRDRYEPPPPPDEPPAVPLSPDMTPQAPPGVPWRAWIVRVPALPGPIRATQCQQTRTSDVAYPF